MTFWQWTTIGLFLAAQAQFAWAVREWSKLCSSINRDWFDYCRWRIDGCTCEPRPLSTKPDEEQGRNRT